MSRVICFSPDHGKTLARTGVATISRASSTPGRNRSQSLAAAYANVQVFENKGAMMGCSNPHPHGQVWATDYVPQEVATEDRTQAAWAGAQPMLLELAERETGGPRVVVETAHWLAIVPWWASWPFETLLLPALCRAALPDLTREQRADLARGAERTDRPL